MTYKETRVSIRPAMILLASLLCLVVSACRSGDPADQMLDQLEQAIVKLEGTVASAMAKSDQRLSADLVRDLGDSGTQVQKTYAEAQAYGSDGLTSQQLKRRTSLTERAVLAVGDMLNIRLTDEKK